MIGMLWWSLKPRCDEDELVDDSTLCGLMCVATPGVMHNNRGALSQDSLPVRAEVEQRAPQMPPSQIKVVAERRVLMEPAGAVRGDS